MKFTFQRKRRRINCLTKKLMLCISSPHMYVWTHFVLKACDDFCSCSPKHYFQLGLLFCQFGWPTNHHSCLWPPPSLQHHIVYLCTCTHILFLLASSKSQTISAFAASVLNILFSICLLRAPQLDWSAKLNSWNALWQYFIVNCLKWVY